MSQSTAGVPELLVGQPDWHTVLVKVLENFACATGTIHRTDSSTGLLTLVTQHGIPPHVLPMLLPKIDNIPFGKGIAADPALASSAIPRGLPSGMARRLRAAIPPACSNTVSFLWRGRLSSATRQKPTIT